MMTKFESTYFKSFNLYVINNTVHLYEGYKFVSKVVINGHVESLNFKRVLAAMNFILHRNWVKTKEVTRNIDSNRLKGVIENDSLFQKICRKNYILKFNELTEDELNLAMKLLGFKVLQISKGDLKSTFFNLSLDSISEQAKQASLF